MADADEPRKHLALLLEAAAKLAAEGPLQVWVAGPGDQRRAVDAAPDAARACTDLLGSLGPDALGDRYARAWVMCLPSEAEAFGMVFVEALASGTPVVGPSTGGPASIIEPGIGITCEMTAASVADACRQAFELAQRPETVERCRSAARRYDWRSGIRPRLEALYRAARQQ